MGSLVDLGQELFKDGPRHPGGKESLPGSTVFHAHDLVVGILLVLGVHLLESEIGVELLDGFLLRRSDLALPVVLVQKGLLFVVGQLMVGLGEEPSALLVGNVRPDLSEDLGRREAVQKVVLGLEVDAHLDQNVPGRVVGRLVRDARQRHGKGHAEVKAVKGRLVLDDEVPALRGEVFEREDVAEGVAELSEFRLECRFQHEVHQAQLESPVVRKVSLDDFVDKGLDGDGVVDGNVPGIAERLVPAGLSPAGDGGVHDVIGHQQPGLEPLDGPSQDGQLAELVVGDAVLANDGHAALHHHQAAVHLSALDGVLQHLAEPVGFPLGEFIVGREVVEDFFDQEVADFGEGSLGIVLVVVFGVLDRGGLGFRPDGGAEVGGFLLAELYERGRRQTSGGKGGECSKPAAAARRGCHCGILGSLLTTK
mmetsp:Transcript_19016/g.53027  ORF Transcript_19016/g.53027 Transcript_19016/m.53027 type:complete len:423 (-) Transcript_19016:112-1380(-)